MPRPPRTPFDAAAGCNSTDPLDRPLCSVEAYNLSNPFKPPCKALTRFSRVPPSHNRGVNHAIPVTNFLFSSMKCFRGDRKELLQGGPTLLASTVTSQIAA